mgnify:CR=1 FL=1
MIRPVAWLTLAALAVAALAAPTAMSPAALDPASAAALERSEPLIEEDRCCEALPDLKDLAVALPDDPDVFNMLGYVHRKMDDLDLSAEHYARALSLDANHLGALEYQGELFLQQGDLDRAMGNLARLAALCGTCEERHELDAAIRALQAP